MKTVGCFLNLFCMLLQSVHIVRQLKALNGGSGMTPDQYYLLKALVLANSDDLTLASSTIAVERQLSKSGPQEQTAVRQFRHTISRALHTHLEMTAVVSSCCCCGSGSNSICCPAATTCCSNGGVTSNCCSCCGNNNTATSQIDNGTNVVVIDNQPHIHQHQRMDTSNGCGLGNSAILPTTASTTTVVVGLVINIYFFIVKTKKLFKQTISDFFYNILFEKQKIMFPLKILGIKFISTF